MRNLFFIACLLIASTGFSQIPAGYYNTAQGLSGTPLRQALHDIIDNHNVVSYNSLWTHFQTTDKKANGKVWDMYSDVPGGTPPYQFTFGTDQCGSYAAEGDCYNREHVWPQSFFNSASPMVSDLFHIYPTDGQVNGIRSNYAFGNCNTTIYNTTLNGSKLGICDDCGSFNGVAFEPIDEYKGDIARSIFYMSTRYYTEDGSWLAGAFANKAELYQWAIDLLLTWHHTDTVSTKEINRNNNVYGIQQNRNPYIDHPEWADSVFAPYAIKLTEQNNLDIKVEIHPNPATNEIYISSTGINLFNYKIIDLYGRELKTGQIKSSEEINISHIEEGTYIIILNNNSINCIRRFIKTDN